MHFVFLWWCDFPRPEDSDTMGRMITIIAYESGITNLELVSFVYAVIIKNKLRLKKLNDSEILTLDFHADCDGFKFRLVLLDYYHLLRAYQSCDTQNECSQIERI